MASETIKIKIVGDPKGITNTIDELERLEKVDKKTADSFVRNSRKVNKGMKRQKGLIEDTEDALKELKKFRDKAHDIKSIKRFNKKIKEAEFDLKKLKNAGTEAFKKVGKEVDKTSKKTKGFNKNLLKIGGAIAAVFAVGRIVAFTKSSVKAFDIQQKAENRLLTALGGRKEVQEDLLAQARKMQEITIFADEDVIAAQSLIAAFTDEKETIKELTRVTLDFATAKGFELPAAAELVSKTFASSTNSLTRYGIQVEGAAGSSERLESITKNLDAAFIGQAEAATTGAGKLQQLGNLWGDLKEKIGGLIVTGITPFAEGLSEMVSSASLFLQTPLSEELEKEQVNVNQLVMEITDVNTKQKRRNELIAILQREYPSLLKNIKKEGDFTKQLKSNLASFNTEASKKIVFEKKREQLLDVLTTKVEKERKVNEAKAKLREELIEINLKSFKGEQLLGNSVEEQARILKDKLVPMVKVLSESRKTGTKELNEEGQAITRITQALSIIAIKQKELAGANKVVADETENYKETVKQLNINLDKEEEVIDDLEDDFLNTTNAVKELKEPFEDIIAIIKKGEDPFKDYADEMERIAKAAKELQAAVGFDPTSLFPDEETDDEFFFKDLKEKIAAADDAAELQRATKEQARDEAIAIADTLAQVSTNLMDKQIQDAQLTANKQTAILEEKLKKGLISEAEFAKQKATIDEKLNKKSIELQRKQAIVSKSASIFQATIATAVGVAKALEVPPPAGEILAVIRGVAGAAQIAAIVSQPLPAFEKGTKGAPEGIAKVGEKGYEYTYLEKGTKVVPHDRSKKYASAIDAMIDDNLDDWVVRNYALEPGFASNVSRSVEYNFDTYPITKRQNKANVLMQENNHYLKQLLNQQGYDRNAW